MGAGRSNVIANVVCCDKTLNAWTASDLICPFNSGHFLLREFWQRTPHEEEEKMFETFEE